MYRAITPTFEELYTENGARIIDWARKLSSSAIRYVLEDDDGSYCGLAAEDKGECIAVKQLGKEYPYKYAIININGYVISNAGSELCLGDKADAVAEAVHTALDVHMWGDESRYSWGVDLWTISMPIYKVHARFSRTDTECS
jgi:hypothetical protein